VQCTGRSAKGPGVDPIDNFVYVGTRQFPVDPNDATTGQNGLIVYLDPSPRQDATPGKSASLSALDGKQNLGSIQFTMGQHRGLRAGASLLGVRRGTYALLVVPTSIGNETVPCGFTTDSTSYCDGPLLGAPLIGAPVLFGVDGAPVARGVIQ
jgi:hypothetical protein